MNNGSRMTFDVELSGIRIFDNILIPAPVNLEFEFIPLMAHKNDFKNKVLQDMAFDKINFWVNEICHGSVYVSSQNEWGVEAASQMGNNIILTPDDPMDDLLAILFHAKISAICSDMFLIKGIKLDGFPNSRVKYTFVLNEEGYPLPNMEEFIGIKSMSPCWWNRDDPTTFDLPADLIKAADNPMLEVFSEITFKDVEERFHKVLRDANLMPKKTPASIVEMNKWKQTEAKQTNTAD